MRNKNPKEREGFDELTRRVRKLVGVTDVRWSYLSRRYNDHGICVELQIDGTIVTALEFPIGGNTMVSVHAIRADGYQPLANSIFLDRTLELLRRIQVLDDLSSI